jgi:hypothetical protein
MRRVFLSSLSGQAFRSHFLSSSKPAKDEDFDILIGWKKKKKKQWKMKKKKQ